MTRMGFEGKDSADAATGNISNTRTAA
jgi:hypothetical protein